MSYCLSAEGVSGKDNIRQTKLLNERNGLRNLVGLVCYLAWAGRRGSSSRGLAKKCKP
jgi:hypothetical protein